MWRVRTVNGYLVSVFESFRKTRFYIRAGLSRREASGISAGRKLFLTIKYLTIYYLTFIFKYTTH